MYFTKDEIITTDKYWKAFPEIYYKTDVIQYKKPMVWRDNKLFPPIKNTPIIISGHSDYAITDENVEYYQPKIWFCVNKQTNKSNIIALPIGITNDTNESQLHTIYGNIDCMIQVMHETLEYKNLIYMNFNVNTYLQERPYVYDLFKDRSYVTIGETINTLDGRIEFLREIKAHTFVLCPRGNGIDTHRLWETLYMGSIPILRKDIAYMDFIDLPICFIDNWEDITLDFLHTEKERICNQTWNIDKLKIGYWLDKILNSIILCK
jgi:hypothetical protein